MLDFRPLQVSNSKSYAQLIYSLFDATARLKDARSLQTPWR